jgi:quercetin dioxygenase-like cupin family protein
MESTRNETIRMGALGVRFLVEPSESGGSISVFECSVPADAKMPLPHSHDGFEETVYGLQGVASFTIDGEAVEIGPGDSVCIPRGVVHGFQNRGADGVLFLAMVSPGVFGPAYFHEIAEVVAASAGGPPDGAAIAEVMRRHGLTPASPPGA